MHDIVDSEEHFSDLTNNLDTDSSEEEETAN